MIVGCYCLHLYCDAIVLKQFSTDGPWRPVQHGTLLEIGGAVQTKGAAMREARAAGWRVREGRVTCPECHAYGKRGVRRV